MSGLLSRLFGIPKRRLDAHAAAAEEEEDDCIVVNNTAVAAGVPPSAKRRRCAAATAAPVPVALRRPERRLGFFDRMGNRICRFAERFVKTGEARDEATGGGGTPNGSRMSVFADTSSSARTANGGVVLASIDLTEDDDAPAVPAPVWHNPKPHRMPPTVTQQPAAVATTPKNRVIDLADSDTESDRGVTTVRKVNEAERFSLNLSASARSSSAAAGRTSRWSRRVAYGHGSVRSPAPQQQDQSQYVAAGGSVRVAQSARTPRRVPDATAARSQYYSPTVDLEEKRRYSQLLHSMRSPPASPLAHTVAEWPAAASTSAQQSPRGPQRAHLDEMGAARLHLHNILDEIVGDDDGTPTPTSCSDTPQHEEDKASTSSFVAKSHSELWLDTTRIDALSRGYERSTPVGDILRDIDSRQALARHRRRDAQAKEQVAVLRRQMVPKSLEELNERLRDDLLIDKLVLPVTPRLADDDFMPLTEEEEDRVDLLLQGGFPDEPICSAFNIDMKRKDLATLHGTTWLNDEVINFYMQLLVTRSGSGRAAKRKYKRWPLCHAFSTFFCGKLMDKGYGAVRRWTKKVDVFTCDLWLVPVHVSGVHWTLATVDLRAKTICYYDSMGGGDHGVLQCLLQYVQDEHKDKKQAEYDVALWTTRCVEDGPRQENGSDCGVFTCKTADFASRDRLLTFSQRDIPMFRRRMVMEIADKKLFA